MAGGRPKKGLDVLPADWEQSVLDMYKEGCADVEIMAYLSISRDLFYRWLDEEPQFSDAIKRGRTLSESWWTRHGRKMATGEAEGNPTTWIFNMKNRFKWTDKVEQSVTSPDGSLAPTKIELVGVKAE